MHAIIDCDSLVYQAGFSSQRMVEGQLEVDPPEEAVDRLDSAINGMLYEVCAMSCGIYLTINENNWRVPYSRILKYKGNRDDAQRPVHYDMLRSHLRKNWHAFIVDYIEADDAVIMDAWQCSMDRTPHVICGIDKDLRQRSGLHYNPRKPEDGIFEVTPHDAAYNFYTQLLTGDTIDNIPGLSKKKPEKGIGQKGAEKILECCSSEMDMYQAVLEAYKNSLGNVHTFTSWQEEEITRPVEESLNENAQLLYLKRVDEDKWSPPTRPTGYRIRW